MKVKFKRPWVAPDGRRYRHDLNQSIHEVPEDMTEFLPKDAEILADPNAADPAPENEDAGKTRREADQSIADADANDAALDKLGASGEDVAKVAATKGAASKNVSTKSRRVK